jgi:phenylacetate-coenzyme A ligase PaaK-like adenylate-forming protein
MTKTDMMDNFDDVVTDRRLTRAAIEDHLSNVGERPTLLAGEYVCLASGGSSGLRGLFVQTWDALIASAGAVLRPSFARMLASGGPPSGKLVLGIVAAPSAIHASRAGSALLDGDAATVIQAPSTLPLAEIVARLNAGQPDLLFGYPSTLQMLAAEQEANRLSIHPTAVTSMSEPLIAEARDRIAAAFAVPVTNSFASTEWLFGASDPGGDPINFATDLAIVELVDERDQPVPIGTPSAKVLLTSLTSTAQPLIRYVLTDSFLRHPDSASHGHLRAAVEGRDDAEFVYGDVRLHPLTIRSALVKTHEIVEYQVRQTARGIDVATVAIEDMDKAALQRRLTQALKEAGVVDREVTVRRVSGIERHADTGKTRRFIPLP